MGTQESASENLWEVYELGNQTDPRWFRRTLRRIQLEEPVDQALVLRVRLALARSLGSKDNRKYAEAEEELRDLLTLNEQFYGRLHEETIDVVRQLALTLADPNHRREGHWKDAEALVRRFRSDLDAADTPQTSETSIVLDIALTHVLVTAALYNPEFEPNEQNSLMSEALPVLEELVQRLGDRWHLDKDSLAVLTNLSTVYSRLDRPVQALAVQEDHLARTREKYLDRTNGAIKDSLVECAGRHAKLGHYFEAEALFREHLSRIVLQSIANKSIEREIAPTVRLLGQLLEHLGRYDEARDLGLKYFEKLKERNFIALGCVPSFLPQNANWLPKEPV